MKKKNMKELKKLTEVYNNSKVIRFEISSADFIDILYENLGRGMLWVLEGAPVFYATRDCFKPGGKNAAFIEGYDPDRQYIVCTAEKSDGLTYISVLSKDDKSHTVASSTNSPKELADDIVLNNDRYINIGFEVYNNLY